MNEFICLSKVVINNHDLSAEGVAVICYLMSKYGCECKVDKDAVRVRFGWGNHTWYRVSRELKKFGFVSEVISNKGSQLFFHIEDVLASADYLDGYMEDLEKQSAKHDKQVEGRFHETVEDGQL